MSNFHKTEQKIVKLRNTKSLGETHFCPIQKCEKLSAFLACKQTILVLFFSLLPFYSLNLPKIDDFAAIFKLNEG